MKYRVKSLMSARLFLFAQHDEGRIYFISNLSGHLSLYAMNYGGSVPEPLLPPNLALQNPDLVDGYSYYVFPQLGQILVMTDRDGDENYQPMLIPRQGGFPEPAFDNYFAKYRVHLAGCDKKKNVVYLLAERRDVQMLETYRGDLRTGKLTKLAEGPWGFQPAGYKKNHSQSLLIEGYTLGDSSLYLWKDGQAQLLYGKPLTERKAGEQVALSGINSAEFAPSGKGAVVSSAVFEDTYGLGYIRFSKPGEINAVVTTGLVHEGMGELEGLSHLFDDHYVLRYNIDGCTWEYEAVFHEEKLEMRCKHVLVGEEPLANGKIEHLDYDEDADVFSVTFSTATSPTQIYTIEGKRRQKIRMHTSERILGIPDEALSAGEDASYITHDGMRISARLYLPADSLGYNGPRPSRVLYTWRPARAGTARFRVVLHAAYPVPDTARVRGVRAQRARIDRLWTLLCQMG